jgi:hypothetical protein
MLFGADTVCKSRTALLTARDYAIVASYNDNDGLIKRLLVCDYSFANYAGAALSAIPLATASSAIKAGTVADNILENLAEVMNVAVNLFIDSFGGRLELESVLRVADLSPETQALLLADNRAKIEVAIPRYGSGRVDLISVV